jgi:cysteine desulfurase
MHANNETGVLQPVEEIARLAKARGAAFHVDAVQTAGKLPGRLSDLGADLISFSAHKFYGPKGAAALYVREGVGLRPILTGGAQEAGLRAGTENVAGIVGLSVALELACHGAEDECRRQKRLRDRFESLVTLAVADARVNGGGAERVPNTSSIRFGSVDGESVVLALDLEGICASTGSACATGEETPSHVLSAMGLSAREAQGTVRFSFGRGTMERDVERTAAVLAKAVARLRVISSA